MFLKIKNTKLSVLFLSIFIISSFLYFNVSNADSNCNFTRTLYRGVHGEDVKCLQIYLNNNGFKISDAGVGSPGNENDYYGGLTEEAVLKWQRASNIKGANGNFGPGSREKYFALIKGSSNSTTQVNTTSVSTASSLESSMKSILKTNTNSSCRC